MGFEPMTYTFNSYIANSQGDQLPDGLIAQLVDHCTGITEVTGSSLFRTDFFFRLQFHNYLSCVYKCSDKL